MVAWVVEAKPTAQALRAKGHMCKIVQAIIGVDDM